MIKYLTAYKKKLSQGTVLLIFSMTENYYEITAEKLSRINVRRLFVIVDTYDSKYLSHVSTKAACNME